MRVAGVLLVFASAAALFSVVMAAPPNPTLHALAGPVAVVQEPVPDPFPLRRQFLTDDQLDRLTADPRGPLRKLTKPEFEAKVRAAGEAVQLARTPPQVVAATYRGKYSTGRLTGTADWTVANPAGKPGLVPLDSLRLAITDLTPADGRTALLFRGKPNGKELTASSLWVGGDRETAVAVGWSVRGVEETDEEKFDLGVPSAAIATLELSLPNDRLPTLTTIGGRRIEATGPFPAGADGERVWKWAVGGQAGVVLAVRPANTPGAEVAASRAAVFDLTPGEVRSAFDFTLDSPRGLILEHTFATDAGVKVTAVTGDGIEKWQQDPADGKSAGKLVVSWREGGSTVRLKVTSTAALGGGAVGWACPGVRATALPGADSIEVNISPDLKLNGWLPGDYRPVVSSSTKGLKLQFTGTLAGGPDGTRRPPTVRVRAAEPEIATDETLTWRVEPGRTRLSATVKVRVVRGPMPQLAFRTAAGFVLESAALVPEDPAVSFGQLPGTPNAWVVEPSRAIPTGQTVEVKLEFRGPPGPPAPDPADPDPAAIPLPFPQFAPLSGVERQGTLTAVGDGVTPTARTVLPVAADLDGWVVKYRGKEPNGVGLFTPDSTGVTVDSVRLAVRNKVCEATVSGRADDGPVGSLTLFVPHPDGQVKAPDGAKVMPLPAVHLLPLLSATDGWSAVTAAGAVQRGVYWRVTFAKPKTGPFEITTSYPAPAVEPSAPLVLPLPTVGGGRGNLTVELTPELAAVYHLGEITTHATLEPLTARPADPPPSGKWQFQSVRQVNQIDGDGGLLVTLSGRVTTAAGRTLDVTLPPAATVESAQVGGKWVTVTAGEVVRLPLPELPPDGLPFEVRYRLPTAWLGPLPRHTSPLPKLPGDADVSARWQFAKGWLPWPSLSDADPCADQTTVRTARSPVLRGIGFGLGGLVFALGVGLVLKGGRWRTAVMVFVVAGCGAGVWVGSLGWLKVLQPPLFVGLGVLVFAALRRVPPTLPRRPSSVTKAVASLLLVGVLAHAQPGGEPAVVYVVGTDAQAVYAPPAVLDKLDQLAAPPLPDVIVTRAIYSSIADDSVVKFDATFTLECPREGEHTFTLPLAGVRLEAMRLDDKDAFPDASKPDRYTIVVKGKGKHTLTAKFAVMPTTTGGVREARFGGPEVHACQITFDAGTKGRQPDVPTRRGGQTVTDRTAAADHGAGRAVAVRWREEADGGAKTTVSVKEAAVWDATDSPEAGVWAAFAYQIAGGGVERFEVEIPAGLVATKVLVRPTDPRATPVGVRGWRIAPSGDGTRVVARLQQPADGRILVLVRAVPAKPLGRTPVLRFPRAAGVADAVRDSVYAVRFPGVVSSGGGVDGAIDFPADAIVKDFPTVSEFAFDKSPPARVVKRIAATAELRPTLAPAPAFVPLGAEAIFTCGAWVEVEGAVRANAKDCGFAEFILPDGIELRDVRAAGMAGWDRTGNKVQVWLKQPAAEVLVRWSGSLPNTGELPLPRWSTGLTPAEPTTVRVRAADGYTIQPTQTTGLKPKVGGEGEFAFTFDGSPPPLKVDVRPDTPDFTRPADPPPAKPAPPLAPTTTPPAATSSEPPPAAAYNPWPVVFAVGWAVGLVVAVVLLRGWGWRPERVATLGVLGMLAAGISTPLGWVFAAAVGVGVLWRMGRVGRRLL